MTELREESKVLATRAIEQMLEILPDEQEQAVAGALAAWRREAAEHAPFERGTFFRP